MRLIYLTCLVLFIQLTSIACTDLEQVEYENIQRVKRIDISRVEKIEISADMVLYKSQKKKLIRLLLEKKDIKSFIECLRGLKHVHLNHPDFPNSWLVNIEIKGRDNGFTFKLD